MIPRQLPVSGRQAKDAQCRLGQVDVRDPAVGLETVQDRPVGTVEVIHRNSMPQRGEKAAGRCANEAVGGSVCHRVRG